MTATTPDRLRSGLPLAVALALAAVLGDLHHTGSFQIHRPDGLRTLAIIGATAGAVVLVRRWPSTNPWLTLFLGWALVASVAGDDPFRSLLGWALLATLAVAAAGVVREQAVVPVLWAITGLLVVASFGFDLVGDARIDGQRLRGLTFEPNNLGQIAGLHLVAAVPMLRRVGAAARTPVVLLGALAAWALWESETRTVMAALALLAVAALVLQRRWRIVLGLGVMAAAGLLVAGDDLGDLGRRNDEGPLTTLNGRNLLWEHTIDVIGDDPITGSGLASGPEDFDAAVMDLGVVIASPSSHSLPLEIARETGLVGLALALLALAAALRRSGPSMLLAYLAVTALTMPFSGLAGVVTLAWLIELQRPASHGRQLGWLG